jgi:hypothetical protein
LLLNKLVADYSDAYLTVNLSSPISSSREMEFFLMLFRNLAQRVIAELQRRLRPGQGDIDAMGRTAIRQERRRALGAMLGIGITLFLGMLTVYNWSARATSMAFAKRELMFMDNPQFGTLDEHFSGDRDILSQGSLERELSAVKQKRAGADTDEVRSVLDHQADVVTQALEDVKRGVQHRKQRVEKELAELQSLSWPWISSLTGTTDIPIYWVVLPLIAVGTIVSFAGVTFMARWRRLTKVRNAAEMGLLLYAERLSRKLDYVITRSTERGLELAPLAWLKGMAKSSDQETARGLSLPELTADYIGFVKRTLQVFPDKLIICIDELDKVTDLDQVRLILREIKGALYVKGSFYILSISDDAMRSFEGRLGDGRDIFESTFDDVFAVRPLDLESCIQVLSARMTHSFGGAVDEPLDRGALATLAVFSAGNGRELIRCFRECTLRGGTAASLKAEDVWNVLYARRAESILARVAVVVGVDDARAKLAELIESVLRTTPGADGSGNRCLCEFRGYLRQCMTEAPSEAHSILHRFMRYTTELELLLCARQRVALAVPSQQVQRDASLIMKAYQALPLSYTDAEKMLRGMHVHPS